MLKNEKYPVLLIEGEVGKCGQNENNKLKQCIHQVTKNKLKNIGPFFKLRKRVIENIKKYNFVRCQNEL